jgi:transglutaminase-like putative cysteine protease
METRARLLAPVALAALSVGAALSLGRVFDSSRFVLPVVGAALVPHAIGAVGRRARWSPLVIVLVSVLGLAAYVAWALEPSTTTWYGVPLHNTWHTVNLDVRAGWHVLRRVPPVATSRGAIVLAVIAVWAMATTADWLAFTRRGVLSALAPALVVFIWTAELGVSGYTWVMSAAFAVLGGAFVYEQNLALLDQRRSWLVTRSRARSTGWVGVALVSVVALAAGLVLAPAMPGADAKPILDVNFANRGTGGGKYQAAVEPLVDVGHKLTQPNIPDLFTVQASRADYWRVTALDQYTSDNGGQWTLNASGSSQVQSGLDEKVPPDANHQEYKIGPRLGERWMPAAYRAVRVSLPDVLVVTASSTLVTDSSSVSGLQYTVDSAPSPRGDEVTAAQQAATAVPVPSDLRQYTELPANFPTSITTLAQTIVRDAGANTPYAKAAALRNYFRGPGFVYDTTVNYDTSTDAIREFLQTGHGFCVQFASAYSVMARAVGLPTRLATGFTPGTLQNGVYVVSSHDTHAWPEVWLADLGWTHIFDPTPATTNGSAGGSDLPGETSVAPVPGVAGPTVPVPPVATATPPNSSAPATTPATGAPTNTTPPGGAPAARPQVSASTSDGGDSWSTIVVLAALVIIALVAAYIGFVVLAKRRRRARRRAGSPSEAIQGAWAEALDRLHEARQRPDPALTPIELSRVTPQRTAPDTAAPMSALARTYTTTRYRDEPPAAADAEVAWTSLEALERALEAPLSGRERWRRRLDASTLRKRTPTRV